MKSLLSVTAIIGALTTVTGDVYPAKYPFENEAEMPPAPRTSTPTYTYDEEDVGGYFYTHVFMKDELETPFCFDYNSGMNWYANVVNNGITAQPPQRPESTYNCTAKGKDNWIDADSFPGTFDGYKVCEVGECCTEFYDVYAYWGGQGEDDWMRNSMEEEFAAGTCTGTVNEPLYCSIMNWGAHSACLEAFTGPSTRDKDRIIGCYDINVHYYLTCPVYKAAGIFLDGREPAQYTDDSTPPETLAGTSMLYTQDKVCHPMSYYFPEYAKESSTPTNDESSGTASSPSSSSSSQATMAFAVAILTLCSAF